MQATVTGEYFLEKGLTEFNSKVFFKDSKLAKKVYYDKAFLYYCHHK